MTACNENPPQDENAKYKHSGTLGHTRAEREYEYVYIYVY
jgi:hypothetical protein